uniref:Glycosyltransferase n=1 Tax=viral metagenome TaxID=1070528 RepID=A0A6C0EJQ0_9ZZZZ
MNIPKKIWTFWDKKKLPDTVEKCVKTWRFFNPNYEINVISMKTIKTWLPEVDIKNFIHAKENNYTRLSDFVRIYVLYKYGGIWIDSSTICTQSFDDWFETIRRKHRGGKKIEYIGFYSSQFTSKKRYKVIENWFFACPKHSRFIKKWRDTFTEIEDYDRVEDWLEDVEELGVDFQKIPDFDDPEYLAQHIAAQKVLQYYKYPQNGIVLFDATETALKYRLFRRGRLSVEQRVKRLCKDYDFWAKTPIIKFTGDDRREMESSRKLSNCVFGHWKNMIATLLTGIET